MSTTRAWGISLLSAILSTGMFVSEAPGQWKGYGPGPRDQHTAVFDAATDQMIVFGGTDLGTTLYHDVWLAVNVITSACAPCELQWTFLSPSGTPPMARSGHSAVYDSVNSRMTVFGGALGFPTPCANDVWVLDHANGTGGASSWTQLSPSGAQPTPRRGHAAAYDPDTNRMIIFGGSDCNGGYLADAWVLTNANGLGGTPVWTKLSPSGGPPPGRAYQAAAYNSSTNSLVVYGGTNGTELSDVWVLSGANGSTRDSAWNELSPQGTAPAARYGQASTYDATNDIMIVYGGFTDQGIVGDAWTLSNAGGGGGEPTWAMLVPTGHAGPQYYLQTAIYDPGSNELVSFGGIPANASTPTTADDFTFVLTQANGLQPRSLPAAP
ncbi:MAG TPA: kelch repeat-containing protein [Terriglobia bacterium]